MAYGQHPFHLMSPCVVSLLILSSTLSLSSPQPRPKSAPQPRPNIVLILADDLGYGDLASYGHPSQEPGPVDWLAWSGVRFTSWYSPDSLCTPSRAATLTGRLPARMGIYPKQKNFRRVFTPDDPGGLPQSEVTVAELLAAANYTTGMIGKWHLGINSHSSSDGHHLPQHHGFQDVATLLPFTNVFDCDENKVLASEPDPRLCFLYRGSQLYQQPINHDTLSDKLSADVSSFIHRHSTDTFFLYLALPHTHEVVWAGHRHRHTSRRGVYGDNVREMQDVVGTLIQSLRDEKIYEETLIIFLSDHGPHVEGCLQGGTTGVFRGTKGTSYEGGYRVPAILSWPSHITEPRTSHDVISSLDLLPTLASLLHIPLPQGVTIDGRDKIDKILSPHLASTSPHLASTSPHLASTSPHLASTSPHLASTSPHLASTSPHLASTSPDDTCSRQEDGCVGDRDDDTIYYYCADRLMAVRQGRYKAHFYTHHLGDVGTSRCVDGVPQSEDYVGMKCYDDAVEAHDPPLLYDLLSDPGERFNLSWARHELTIISLMDLAQRHLEGMTYGEPQISQDTVDKTLTPCHNPPQCRLRYPE